MIEVNPLKRFEALPKRSRELVLHAVRRPELHLTDISRLVGISVGNMRDRMNKVYSALDVENRGHLIAVYGPLLSEVDPSG